MRMAAPNGRFLLPRHVWELRWQLDRRGRGRLRHFEFIIAGLCIGIGPGHVAAPRGNARLQAVVLGGGLVARFHVSAGKIGVRELIVRPELLGFVAFVDGPGIVTLGEISAAERELGIEVYRIGRENGLQHLNRSIGVPEAEFKHRVVVLILKARRHALNLTGVCIA